MLLMLNSMKGIFRKGFNSHLLLSISIHAVLILIFFYWLSFQKKPIEPVAVTVAFQADKMDIPVIKGDRLDVPVQKTQEQDKVLNPVKGDNPPKTLNQKVEEAIRQKDPSAVLPQPEGNQKNDNKVLETSQSSATNLNARNDTGQNNASSQRNNELDDLSGDIDLALNDGRDKGKETGDPGELISGGDPLSDAKWSSKPRKTLYYPDIQSKIPDSYRKKGLSYSLQAVIVFDKNGLAVKVDIIKSSGDHTIDALFEKELKKVRIEPVNESRLVEISKVFLVNVR